MDKYGFVVSAFAFHFVNSKKSHPALNPSQYKYNLDDNKRNKQ